jgi:hypothetical protein
VREGLEVGLRDRARMDRDGVGWDGKQTDLTMSETSFVVGTIESRKNWMTVALN